MPFNERRGEDCVGMANLPGKGRFEEGYPGHGK